MVEGLLDALFSDLGTNSTARRRGGTAAMTHTAGRMGRV
jgi:hypothetical protein